MKFTKMLAMLALSMSVVAGFNHAQRPTRIIVPFTPGGNTDLVARIVAERLASKLGTPVIVENKAGAGAVVGSEFVARAAPDGSTLLLTTVAHAVTRSLRKSLSYDPLNDFTPLYIAARSPQLMLVHNGVPADTLGAFLDLMRANPGHYKFGSSGTGSALHLAGELLRQQAKVDIQHIPYKGTGQAINDLIAGHIDFIIDPISTAAEFAKSGRVKALGITSASRSPVVPNVPTFKEAGVPGYEAYTWAAVLAPKGLAPQTAQKLNQALADVMSEPATRQRFIDLGLEPISKMTLAEADGFIRSETQKWSKVIETAGIRPE